MLFEVTIINPKTRAESVSYFNPMDVQGVISENRHECLLVFPGHEHYRVKGKASDIRQRVELALERWRHVISVENRFERRGHAALMSSSQTDPE